jgi:hypothetical protein
VMLDPEGNEFCVVTASDEDSDEDDEDEDD